MCWSDSTSFEPETRAGADWYELVHDRLVAPIVLSNAAWAQTRQRAVRSWAIVALSVGLAIVAALTAFIFLANKRSHDRDKLL